VPLQPPHFGIPFGITLDREEPELERQAGKPVNAVAPSNGRSPSTSVVPDADFEKLSRAEKLERVSGAALDFKTRLITSTDPTSDDVPRIKAALSAAQSILTIQTRVDKSPLRQTTDNSRQHEIRARMHRQVIRLLIEKGQLPPDAMDRFVALLAEGVDSLVASRTLV
jgi:hypothetical protein